METKKKNPNPKHYVTHPSSARCYPDLCHLHTFLPFLKFFFPPVFQSQATNSPSPRAGSSCSRPSPGSRPPCTSPQHPRSKGWYPGLHPPREGCPGGISHPTSIAGAPSPVPASQGALRPRTWYPRSPTPPHMLGHVQFFSTAKNPKAVGFKPSPVPDCRETFPQKQQEIRGGKKDGITYFTPRSTAKISSRPHREYFHLRTLQQPTDFSLGLRAQSH